MYTFQANNFFCVKRWFEWSRTFSLNRDNRYLQSTNYSELRYNKFPFTINSGKRQNCTELRFGYLYTTNSNLRINLTVPTDRLYPKFTVYLSFALNRWAKTKDLNTATWSTVKEDTKKIPCWHFGSWLIRFLEYLQYDRDEFIHVLCIYAFVTIYYLRENLCLRNYKHRVIIY